MSSLPPSSTALNVLHKSDGIAVGEIGSVCVVVWRDDVTHSRFEIQRRALESVVKRHGVGSAFLCIVEADVKPPPDDLRRASSVMVAQHQEQLRAVAGVIEGTGFKAALTRSVLSGITSLVRNRKAPISYFATVGEASTWLSDHLPIEPGKFSAAVDALRAESPEALRSAPVC
jgi:hypothetical protein